MFSFPAVLKPNNFKRFRRLPSNRIINLTPTRNLCSGKSQRPRSPCGPPGCEPGHYHPGAGPPECKSPGCSASDPRRPPNLCTGSRPSTYAPPDGCAVPCQPKQPTPPSSREPRGTGEAQGYPSLVGQSSRPTTWAPCVPIKLPDPCKAHGQNDNSSHLPRLQAMQTPPDTCKLPFYLLDPLNAPVMHCSHSGGSGPPGGPCKPCGTGNSSAPPPSDPCRPPPPPPPPPPCPSCPPVSVSGSSYCKDVRKRKAMREPCPCPQPDECIDKSAVAKAKTFRAITLFVTLPLILIAMGIILPLAEKERKRPRPEYIPYSYMYQRTHRFPWGDGNHSLFHNKRRNAVPPHGYEAPDVGEEDDDD